MHKGKVVAGACIVVLGAAFLSAVLYARLVLDCADIGESLFRQGSFACDLTPNYYYFLALSPIMVGGGLLLLVAGLRSLSLVTLKKS